MSGFRRKQTVTGAAIAQVAAAQQTRAVQFQQVPMRSWCPLFKSSLYSRDLTWSKVAGLVANLRTTYDNEEAINDGSRASWMPSGIVADDVLHHLGVTAPLYLSPSAGVGTFAFLLDVYNPSKFQIPINFGIDFLAYDAENPLGDGLVMTQNSDIFDESGAKLSTWSITRDTTQNPGSTGRYPHLENGVAHGFGVHHEMTHLSGPSGADDTVPGFVVEYPVQVSEYMQMPEYGVIATGAPNSCRPNHDCVVATKDGPLYNSIPPKGWLKWTFSIATPCSPTLRIGPCNLWEQRLANVASKNQLRPFLGENCIFGAVMDVETSEIQRFDRCTGSPCPY